MTEKVLARSPESTWKPAGINAMLFPNLEVKIAAMKEREALRKAKKKAAANARHNATAMARRKILRAAMPKIPRRRRHPLDNSVRALRVRLRKQIAAGALPADTDLSNEALRKEIARRRHSRGALRFYHRTQRQIRSERWAEILAANAQRRADIEARKADRAQRKAQAEQFRRRHQLTKPKTKKEISFEQRIAQAFADGFQAGKQFERDSRDRAIQSENTPRA